MSGLEPIPIISLALSISSQAYKILKDFSKSNLLLDSSATIDWENGLFEQEWKMKSGGGNSLRSLFNRTIEISNVVEHEGFIFPAGQKLDAISQENYVLRKDLKKIEEIDASQTITIRFKTPFDKEILYRNLCEKHIVRIPQFIAKDVYALSFSIMLNRADLLLNDFKSVYYVNIRLPFVLFLTRIS
jgi:hypothetical protein